MNNQLNISERNELERCEVVIKQGLQTFVEVGQALMLIRDKRLYRSEFGTFEDYCRQKWNMVQQSATRLIRAAETITILESEPIGSLLPQTESHARPLTKLEPELQAEAWQQVVDQHGENITQKKVQEVVKEFVPINNELKQAKKEPMFAARTKEEILDAAKKKAERESKLLKDTKANIIELTTFVNPYDENMFFLQENYNDNRFDDHIVNISDDKYPTLTTGTKLFDSDLVEYPLRFYSKVQTFPNNYKFCGPKTAIKTQIGNSVAPEMAKYISQFVSGKTVGDLFGGCGGFSCGFHQNGFETVWCVEWDKNAANSFKLNFPSSKVYNSNIVGFDTSILDKVDVIIGGPPCKGFSLAGYQFKDDPRNELYKEFLRVVNDLKPNQFIMENVLQVKSIANEIINDFKEIGYNIETKIVHGNDIGMKQNRKRFFFIGTKND